jgi:DNA-binding XRE family transcriptional regulator
MKHKEKSKKALQKLGGLAKHHSINQSDIADLLNVRQQTVSQVFVGRFNPMLDTVIRYLEAINELAGTEYSLKDIDYE